MSRSIIFGATEYKSPDDVADTGYLYDPKLWYDIATYELPQVATIGGMMFWVVYQTLTDVSRIIAAFFTFFFTTNSKFGTIISDVYREAAGEWSNLMREFAKYGEQWSRPCWQRSWWSRMRAAIWLFSDEYEIGWNRPDINRLPWPDWAPNYEVTQSRGASVAQLGCTS